MQFFETAFIDLIVNGLEPKNIYICYEEIVTRASDFQIENFSRYRFFCVKFNVDLIHSSCSEFFLNRIAIAMGSCYSQEQNQTFSIFVSRASAHSMETLSKSMSKRFLEFWSVSGFLKFSKKLNFNSKFGRHSFSVNSFISKLFFS